MKATSSVSRSGLFQTLTPRARHAAGSTASQPMPRTAKGSGYGQAATIAPEAPGSPRMAMARTSGPTPASSAARAGAGA